MEAFERALDGRAFRPERALNAAVFDSMSVALARAMSGSGEPPGPEETRLAHQDLLADEEYLEAVSRATANEQSVTKRMAKAAERFAALR